MKKVRKIVAFCMCVVLLLSLQVSDMVLTVLAESAESEEQKIYSGATVDDAFADNSILVVLSNEASLENLGTEKLNFAESNLKNVRDLTSSRGKQIKAMVDERNNSSLAERMFTSDPNVDEIAEYHQVVCIELKERGKDKVLEAIKLLEQREDVLYVCPDYIFSACSDTVSSTKPTNKHWNPEAVIKLPEAQNMDSNENTIYVGVLDTGIDDNHPWLDGKIASGGHQDFVSDEPSSACSDLSGHGTHVAGIIATTAQNVKLISLRVMDSYMGGKSSYLIAALDYVNSLKSRTNNPISIPILNFSGEYKTDNIQEISNLFASISQYGGLFVCGAGNDKVTLGVYGSGVGAMRYPASFSFTNNDTMIVVGASNQSDNGLWIGTKKPGSNWGSSAVDIFAPGDTILSCYPSALCVGCFNEDGSLKNLNHEAVGYHYMSGTSMATPYVTGVAAMILSIAPNMEALSLKQIITDQSYVDKRYNSKGENELICVSGGRLNAYEVMSAVHEMGYHTFGEWVVLSDDQHHRVCAGCGDEEIKSHTFIKEFVNTCVFFTCADCGYYKEQHAQSFIYVQNDASTHCVTYPCCNTSTEVSHSGVWVDLNSTYHQRTCTDCGYIQLQAHSECWSSAKNMCLACKRTAPITTNPVQSLPSEEDAK